VSALPDTGFAASEPGFALAGVGTALRRLRVAVSLESLFREAANALCETVGFERAAVFSVQGRSLTLESMWERGARGSHDVQQRRAEPVELGPWMREAEVLRRRQPLLVEDAVNDRRAYGLLPGARSFVAAPAVCHERAVALLHADREGGGEAVTGLDRDALWVFAEGFGYALERCLLRERLQAQCERMVALVRSTEASVAELGGADIALPAPALRFAPKSGPTAPDHGLEALLTRRELEVLGMLAEGETNARIAQRLVVSDDTVKTHVKHILRKLGVNNRSQAVSRHFQAQAASEDAHFKEQRSPIRSMRAAR
jgi:LuxR family transcriptional regulator, regulator of acetate metabolism